MHLDATARVLLPGTNWPRLLSPPTIEPSVVVGVNLIL